MTRPHDDHATPVEEDLLDALFETLARVARQHDVMITLTVTPFDGSDDARTDDVTTEGYQHA